MSDGKVEYEITGDASGLAGAARRGESAIGGLSGAGRVMAAGLTAAIAGVTAAATGMGLAIREAAKIETTETGIKTLVKDAGLAKAIVNDLKKLGAETPFELGDLASAARGLLQGGTAVKDLRKELTILGDLSSGAQTDLQGLVLVLNQVRGAGKLMGGDFLQLQQKGIGGLREELAKIEGIPLEDLAKAIENGKISADELFQAFTNLTREGGLFFRAMIFLSQTLEGRLSTLRDAFAELLRVPGEAGLETTKKMVDTLIEGTQRATRGASIFVKTIELASQNGRLGEFLSLSLRLAFAEATMAFLKGMRAAIGTVADALGGAVSKALEGDLSGAKEVIKTIFDFSPAGRLRDVLKLDDLRAEFGEFTKAGRLALEQGLKETADKMQAAMNGGAEKVSGAAAKLKDILNKGTGEKKDGDRDGDGIISKREQRRLDLDQKRAERRANSAKGFSFEKAGLGGFGGLDEFFGLQFRDGADGTGFEGKRAFSAFGDRRRGVASASQVGRASRIFNGVEAADMPPREAAFRRINEGRNAGVNNTGNTGEQGNLSALEAILLELKRIRTR